MATSTIDLDLEPMPAPPTRKDWQIGCIGAGFIMADVQIPSYLAAGFQVAAIASRTEAHARAVAERHGIETVHAGWRELLDDERIQVVDIAFPPDQQLEIVEAACDKDHVKGILVQKPIAANYAEARRAVAACANSDKILAVNQNMRYDQSMRALRRCSTAAISASRCSPPSRCGRFRTGRPSSRARTGSRWRTCRIHHLDIFRYLFGDPEGIFVSARTDPRTKFDHRDGICLYILEYANGMRASAWDDVWTRARARGLRGRHLHQAGASRAPTAWPGAPSAGPTTRRRRRPRSRSRPRSSRATCSSRSGPRCGSRMRSPAPWARSSRARRRRERSLGGREPGHHGADRGGLSLARREAPRAHR